MAGLGAAGPHCALLMSSQPKMSRAYFDLIPFLIEVRRKSATTASQQLPVSAFYLTDMAVPI